MIVDDDGRIISQELTMSAPRRHLKRP
jgi:hypothetical protein